MEIQSPYIVGNIARKVAERPGSSAFGKLEEPTGNYVLAEDRALAMCMAEEDGCEPLDLGEARKYYATLDKAE